MVSLNDGSNSVTPPPATDTQAVDHVIRLLAFPSSRHPSEAKHNSLTRLRQALDDAEHQEQLNALGWATLFEPRRDGRAIVVRNTHIDRLWRHDDFIVVHRFDLVLISSAESAPSALPICGVRIVVDYRRNHCRGDRRECSYPDGVCQNRDVGLVVYYAELSSSELSATSDPVEDRKRFDTEVVHRSNNELDWQDLRSSDKRVILQQAWSTIQGDSMCLTELRNHLDASKLSEPWTNMTIRNGILRSRSELAACLSESEAARANLPGDVVLCYRHWSRSEWGSATGLFDPLHDLIIEYLGDASVADAKLTDNEASQCHDNLIEDLVSAPILIHLDLSVWRDYQRLRGSTFQDSTFRSDKQFWGTCLGCPSVIPKPNVDLFAVRMYLNPFERIGLHEENQSILLSRASSWVPIFQDRLRMWLARPEILEILNSSPPLDDLVLALEQRIRILTHRCLSTNDSDPDLPNLDS